MMCNTMVFFTIKKTVKISINYNLAENGIHLEYIWNTGGIHLEYIWNTWYFFYIYVVINII